MTGAVKDNMFNVIEQLEPLDTTNLWDGLRTGMDLICDTRDSCLAYPSLSATQRNRNTTLFLLTDGMPNVVPLRGHIPALKAYFTKRCPSSAPFFSIHTFGFGCSIDTPLLLEIATIGGGGYNFIHDAGMVGTVFVNAVASSYAVYAQRIRVNCQLSAAVNRDDETLNDFKVEVKGELEGTQTSSGISFQAGEIMYGQPKHYVLEFRPSIPSSLRVSATYHPIKSGLAAHTNYAELQSSQEPTKEELAEIEYHAAALTLASILLTTTSETRDVSRQKLQDLHKRLTRERTLRRDPHSADLAEDIAGQCLDSVSSSANFERWGKHYGPSLANAHQRQYCQNFRDKALQNYGISPTFAVARSDLEVAFHSITPSPSTAPKSSTPLPGTAQPPPSSMVPTGSSDSQDVDSSTSSALSYGVPSAPAPPVLPQPPSPQYAPMLSQFAQYAPGQTSPQKSRQSSLSRLRSFMALRRGQSPPSSQGQGLYPSPPFTASPRNTGDPSNSFGSVMTAVPSRNSSPDGCSPSQMSLYFDRDAPCFAGRCLVRVSGHSNPVRVDQLRRGDVVQTLSGYSGVVAVLCTNIRTGNMLLCRLGALEVTPWHPVRLSDARAREEGRWMFPADVVKPTVVPCDAVYSILLEKEDDCPLAHSISVSGVWCLTLGHGLLNSAQDDVRAHPFLGDYDKVLEEISCLDGFRQGGGIVRCAGTKKGPDGLVCGFVGESTV
jgi:hypothetical protein